MHKGPTYPILFSPFYLSKLPITKPCQFQTGPMDLTFFAHSFVSIYSVPDAVLGTRYTSHKEQKELFSSQDSLLTVRPDSPNSVLPRAATAAFQKWQLLSHNTSAESEYGAI